MKFTIKKGRHYSRPRRIRLVSLPLEFQVRFDRSCLYDLGNANQADWNKLLSVRLPCLRRCGSFAAWRANGGKIEVAPYANVNGMNFYPRKGVLVDVDEWHNILLYSSGKCLDMVIDRRYGLWAKVDGTPPSRGLLGQPYFGGDEAAPHDMKIGIRL